MTYSDCQNGVWLRIFEVPAPILLGTLRAQRLFAILLTCSFEVQFTVGVFDAPVKTHASDM